MRPADFLRDRPGTLVRIGPGQWAFVPARLPPQLDIDWRLASLLAGAQHGLGALSGYAGNLPNPHLLINPFVRREALSSSRIEGTQASMSDLLLLEATDKPSHEDVLEVRNYVRALDRGLSRLGEFPVSLRLIRELHATLMKGVRGAQLTPGEFRRTQNWIGPAQCTLEDATYVPPPVPQMLECLHDLETHLHEQSELPYLIRLALLHYQFEAIHPFLDGNGRVGRLLITLLLCHAGLLTQPLLYLSSYFERHRDEYYRHLLAVSQGGAWREWIEFFLTGIIEQALDAGWCAHRLQELWQEYHTQFKSARSSALTLKLIDSLFETPMLTIPKAAELLHVTPRAAALNIQKLVDARLLRELPRQGRLRIFLAPGVLEVSQSSRPRVATGRKNGAAPRGSA
jgi:Fic family protein